MKVLLFVVACAFCLSPTWGQGGDLHMQISRINGRQMGTLIDDEKLKLTSGNEAVAVSSSKEVFIPKVGEIDLSEAITKAREYATKSFSLDFNRQRPKWIVEGAKLETKNSDQGLRYYLISMRPRPGLTQEHDGMQDYLGIIVLLSGEVLPCKFLDKTGRIVEQPPEE